MQPRIKKSNNKSTTHRTWRLLAVGCILAALAWTCMVQTAAAEASSSTWFVEMDRYTMAAHGSLKCRDCHGSMMGEGKSHPDPQSTDFLRTSTKRSFNYTTCKRCHESAYDRYQKGAHAKAVKTEDKGAGPFETGIAPACGDCHSAHYSKSGQSRAVVGKKMTQTCGTCHPDQKKSFLANYHGKAGVNLGYEKSAFCTDCHGAHTNQPLKEATQVLNACKRCHFDAPPEFANIIIHDDKNSAEQKNSKKRATLKWVHLLAALSLTFVTLVLIFSYTHTGLLILRKLHEKLRRHK